MGATPLHSLLFAGTGLPWIESLQKTLNSLSRSSSREHDRTVKLFPNLLAFDQIPPPRPLHFHPQSENA